MRVTIISDASVCMQTHVGGYGYWAVSDRGRHAGSGSFKNKVRTSDQAEMMAIVNAIHAAVCNGIAETADSILVQTDSQNAIAYFEQRTKRIAKDSAPIVDAYKTLVAAHALKVEFRHVRGHTKDGAQRSIAQRHSDMRARKAMKLARKQKSAS